MHFLFHRQEKCGFCLPTQQNASLTTRDVIGQAGHAEIWDSEAYDKLEAETLTPEALAAVMEELDF